MRWMPTATSHTPGTMVQIWALRWISWVTIWAEVPSWAKTATLLSLRWDDARGPYASATIVCITASGAKTGLGLVILALRFTGLHLPRSGPLLLIRSVASWARPAWKLGC